MAKRKAKKQSTPTIASNDDDLSFNINLTQEQKKKLFIAVLILIPLFLAVFFRAYPATLPVTDQWAEQAVANSYRNQFAQQIRSQFPNLPQAQADAKVNQLYADLVQQNPEQLNGQIEATSNQFKQFMKNDNGETYLLAIDPWVYYMDAQNILERGHAGTEIRDGKPYEGKMVAPLGQAITTNWHSYVTIITWKILSFFKNNMSLMGGMFWVPLIIASLATIPAFFLARRKAGNLGGFVAASVVAVHSAFLGRTPAGFSDTDAYNVTIPLLVAWLFLEAFEAKELWKKLSLSAASGIILGIYSKIWVGYWYIFDILLAVVIGYSLFLIIQKLYVNYILAQKNKAKESWKDVQERLKQTGLLTAVFVGTTGILISLFLGFMNFITLPLGVVSFTQLKNAVNPSLWPNVLTTVAELNEVNFAGVVGSMGGKFLFFLALLGIAASLIPRESKLNNKDFIFIGLTVLFSIFLVSNQALNYNPIIYLLLLGIPLAVGMLFLLGDKRNIDVKFALLLLVWSIVTMYATTKGVRFTLVLVPPLAVAIGTFIGTLHTQLAGIIARELAIAKKIVVPVLAVILCLILIAPIQTAHAVGLSEVPSMNDAWYTSLTGIRDNSQENAIITSWWDFGHWFKSIAERSVTFDGGTQNRPMAHWVGKLLLSTDETESKAILRMLDCGSFTGFDRLKVEIQDTVQTKKLMDAMLLLDKEQAAELLKQKGLSEQAITEVLALTHCAPPEGFLITSQDMVGKAGVWGHFGAWDFERAYIYNNLKQKSEQEATQEMVNKFNKTEQEAQTLYYQTQNLVTERAANTWISPWPGYITGWISCQEQLAQVNTTALGTNTTTSGKLENRTLVVCPTQLNLGSSNGGTTVLEAVIIDPQDPATSRFRYGFYSGNARVQQSDAAQPRVIYYANENVTNGIDEYLISPENNVGIMFDAQNNRVLLADPLHAGSLFTQLFYLDGKYNKDFEKFSDKTSFNGQRIIVWKAVW